MKKIILILISIILVFSAVSCEDSREAKIYSMECPSDGCKFQYYEGWEKNETDIGASIKTSPDAKGISCGMIVVLTSDSVTPASEELLNILAESFASKEIKKAVTSFTVSGEKAYKLELADKIVTDTDKNSSEESENVKERVCIAIFDHDSLQYTVILTTTEEEYDNTVQCYDEVLKTFEFIPRVISETDYSGGKAESVNKDYEFTYSSGWGLKRNDGLIILDHKGGNASISMQVFSLPSEKSNYGVYTYWKEYAEELTKTFPSFKVTKEYSEKEEPRLDGVLACRKEYSITVDGVEYKYVHILCISEGYVYSMVMTSDEAEYEEAVSELEKIITNFNFK